MDRGDRGVCVQGKGPGGLKGGRPARIAVHSGATQGGSSRTKEERAAKCKTGCGQCLDGMGRQEKQSRGMKGGV